MKKKKKKKNHQLTEANDDRFMINSVENENQEIVQDSISSRIPLKKQKRRPKISDRIKSDCGVNVRDNSSTLKNKSVFSDTLASEQLPCNIVNLTLSDLTRDEDQTVDQKVTDKTNDSNQQSLCKTGKQKNGRRKHNTRIDSTVNQQNEQNPVELPSAETKIVTEKAPFVEADYSVPVYQKFLSFNACTSTLEKNVKIEKEDFDQKCDSEKNDKQFEDSLPLTGDPEIDEEIIAFYKAKRSGGIY
ncbi:hypothetical protein WN51_04199 [Melipona quadrifasciata]|uniref:Uncharacterized protein n=1 Tax=Melipona quadrifasciata TaxID=166423 RepID=A0A0M8ZW10_9HYME|nr:hypothetical protein WN51_04199 [Melipona quadrifasciata]